MKYKFADLHIHSYYSDGTMSAREIVETALDNQVGLIAITDHDMLDGAADLINLCLMYPISYITGVEIDTIDQGINYHILGYGVDLEDREFRNFISNNRFLLDEVNTKLIEKLQADYDDITLQDYHNFSYNRQLGGWKALHYFMYKGMTQSIHEGFKIYSRYSHSHDSVSFPSIKTTCEQVHKAGGKAILAHPGKVIKTNDLNQFKHELLRIIALGIDGIECYYPSHSKKITNLCLELCEQYNLIITCGSDCHGEFQDTHIGQMKVAIEQLNLKDIIIKSNLSINKQ